MSVKKYRKTFVENTGKVQTLFEEKENKNQCINERITDLLIFIRVNTNYEYTRQCRK